MNNEVKNPKQELPTGTEMNDCDYLKDLLTNEKYLISNYAIFLIEASNESLYEDLFTISQETHDLQREIFDILFEKGWYKLEKAEGQKVTTVLNEYETKLSELSEHEENANQAY